MRPPTTRVETVPLRHGHGAAELPQNLNLRHGRLAVRSAIAWCGFMLDTLHDRQQS